MKNLISSISIILGIFAVSISLYNTSQISKIGFIRSAKVIEEFQGYREAQTLYQSKLSEWTANLDTLKKNYQSLLINYQTNIENFSDQEKAAKEQMLLKRQEDMQRFTSETEQMSKEEYERILQGALNQVNAYVEEYSKKEGYDIIFGVTTSGNIMYGVEAIDLTDQVIKGLNDSY